MLHHAFVSTHPEPTSQRYITKPQTLRFSSHTSVLNFAGAALHITPRMRANHEPTFQRYTTKPQTLRFSSHTSVLNFAGTALHITPHMWANHPEPTSQDTLQTSDPKMFISHIPLLNFAGTALHITPRMCANPEPTSQRYITKPQTLRFSSHTSVLNFAGTALHVTPRMCANPSSSLFWTLPEQITPRMCAKPSWTNVQRHTTKPETPIFSSHASLFWTLPEQLAMLHRACEPTHPVPTSQDTPQTTNDSILQTQPHPTSQDTPLKISMFTLQAAKMSSLARRHGRMKTCVRPSGQKMVLSKLQWLKLPARPTYCKNVLKRSSLGWNPLASWFIEKQNSKICKGPKARSCLAEIWL